MKPTKMQREWLEKLLLRPVWYQHIPKSVLTALKKNRWATRQVYANQLCFAITPAGRAVLEKEDDK